jgi:hypothetical protein
MQTLTDGYTSSNPAITAKIQRNIREIRKNMQQQEARNSKRNDSHRSAD